MPINPWNGSPSPSHGQKLAWQRLLSLSFHVSPQKQNKRVTCPPTALLTAKDGHGVIVSWSWCWWPMRTRTSWRLWARSGRNTESKIQILFQDCTEWLIDAGFSKRSLEVPCPHLFSAYLTMITQNDVELLAFSWFARTFSTVHCNVTVARSDDATLLVETNRQITFGAVVRRRPNAFTLVHQMRFMKRANLLDSTEQAGGIVCVGCRRSSCVSCCFLWLFFFFCYQTFCSVIATVTTFNRQGLGKRCRVS